jgi:hypothetical protein
MSTRLNPSRSPKITGPVESGNTGKDSSSKRSNSTSRSGRQSRGREKLNVQTVLALVGGIIAVAIAVFAIRSYLLDSGTPGDPNLTIYVDSINGQSFSHRTKVGESVPIVSPLTNQKTGYPGVPCFWTKDGHLRKDPFWLILNSALGKPEPTFCPDCGRLVRPRQPAPKAGDRPPPTQDELLHNR